MTVFGIAPSAVAETLLASSLLMLVVLAVRRPVARHFGAHVAYALWALPVLRLILPPLPGWQSPAARLLAWLPAAPPVVRSGDTVSVDVPTVPDLAATAAVSPDWAFWLFTVWLAGAVAWLAWQVIRHQRFLRNVLADAELLTRQGHIDVLTSAAVTGPMAMGVRHRRILLPVDFRTRFTPAERRMALLHEGAHHDRGDIIANVVGLLVLAAHWWNPLAHFAWRAFRADQELACDATVIAGSAADDQLAYGHAMLKSASAGIPSAACAMNTKTQLKDRIAMIKRHDLSMPRRRLGLALGIGGIAAGLAISAAAAPPVAPAPPAPVAPIAVPVAAVPVPPAAAPPAAPAVPQRQIRKIVIKDGRVIENSTGGASVIMIPRDGTAGMPPLGDLAELEMLEALAVSVADTATKDARPRLIITCKRHVGAGAEASASDDCRRIEVAAASVKTRDALVTARKSVETSPGLTDEQRRAALTGIDKAIAETGDAPVAR